MGEHRNGNPIFFLAVAGDHVQSIIEFFAEAHGGAKANADVVPGVFFHGT